MKIAIVTPSVHRRGGTEKCLAWLTEDLSQVCDVTLYVGDLADTDVSRVRVRRLPMIGHPRLLRYVTFLASNTLAFLWRRVRGRPAFDAVITTGGDCFWCDFVYAHFCCAAWSEMLLRREAALPAQGLRQRLRNLHYRVFLAVAAAVERTIYRRPALRAAIAVSGGTKDDLIRFYGLAPESVAVVPNAVDDRVRLGPEDRRRCREEIRARHRIREESVVLLFVGAGDWKRKGLLVLLEALAMLTELDLHLVVVGREDVPYYEKETRRLGVGDRVVFAGFRKDIERYYASADIFVYPSAYEAFSLVSLEAAGAGLPLLVSRVNGTEDLVRPGVNGLFIEREPSDIAAKIRLLAGDPVLRGRMAAASAQASRAYSRQAVAERVLGLLQSSPGPPGRVVGGPQGR